MNNYYEIVFDQLHNRPFSSYCNVVVVGITGYCIHFTPID